MIEPEPAAMEILTVSTPTLGDRSYVATDGEVAVVVDPQRDTDRVVALTAARDLRITHVLETHIHNDYVTGGHVLAQHVGAEYVLNAADDVTFDRRGVIDGDEFTSGRLRIHVIATPGHTFTHLAYAIEVGGKVRAVFTGGSLLYGSTGRPDLLGEEHAASLARAQHRSARRLVEQLPAVAGVFPTHGFGSFCSVSQHQGDASTLEAEVLSNPVLIDDEETFVRQVLAGLDAYPTYYAYMGPRNAAGPDPIDLSPPHRADAEEVRRRIAAGEWIVDLRSRAAFAPGHVPGSLNIGLDGSFATYVGWLVPWETPVTLLAETPEEIARAQRELVRIGIDRPAAASTGDPQQWAGGGPLAQYPRATFSELGAAVARRSSLRVLDVRRYSERRDSAISGSIHIPLHEVPSRLREIPRDAPVWIHCAAGYRASIAASFITRTGRDVVLIDDVYDPVQTQGLEVPSIDASAS